MMTDPINCEERTTMYLTKLLDHVTKNCPFYTLYRNQNFQVYPVVDKSILLRNYESIGINIQNIPNQEGPIHIQSTSGSTGTPFAVPQDTVKKRRRIAELKYFGELAGFKSHEKLIHLRAWNKWQSKTKMQSIRENIIPFNTERIDKNSLKELCTIIKEKKAVAIRGYASSIDLLARYVSENNLNLPSIKIIIAGSESLNDSTRELVAKYFRCKIISQYANEENGILAQEELSPNQHKSFLLNHASYIFEVLRMDEDRPAAYGELGRIVITDLFNYAFPLIRYDTGDTGIIQRRPDAPHGRAVLTQLYGRRIDLVYNTHGEIIHPTAISRMLKHYHQILQWQFAQESKTKYSLKLIAKEGNINTQNITEDLLNLMGNDASIRVKFTDELPVLASGKRKPVVNNWKP